MTDAIQTLGTILDSEQGRDAIHLAVICVPAGETLNPGTRVFVSDSGFAFAGTEGIGIVDPFLRAPVVYEQRFWLVLNPRTITSLRHVWSHPSFPDEPDPVRPSAPNPANQVSAMLRIRELCTELDCSVDRLMEGAATYLKTGEYLSFGVDLDYDWPFNEFWRCYEVVTGKEVGDDAHYFFRCAC